jgi:hypothetical protein
VADKYQELQAQLGLAAVDGRFEDAAKIRQEIQDSWDKDQEEHQQREQAKNEKK